MLDESGQKTYVPPDDLSDKKLSEFQPKTYVPPEQDETLDPIPPSSPSPFGESQPDPGYVPLPPDRPIGEVLGGPPKTYVSPPPAPAPGLTSEAAAPTFLTQEEQQRAEELERYEQAPGELQGPPVGGGDEDGIPGLGVPYRDFIPTFPMVKDLTTGQWRNAEPGEIAGAEGGEQLPPVTQTPEAEPPVQPTPPPPGDTEGPGSQAQEVSPLQFGNTGNFQNAPDPNAPPPGNEEYGSLKEVPPLQFGNTGNLQNAPEEPPVGEQQPAPAPAPPDADGDGIPNEYGDGPDLDANGIPDEIGINSDSLQPGYPDSPATSGEWGGVGVPDPSVVPRSDAATDAEVVPEAVPEEEYGGGSEPDGDWVPDETGIDRYALQKPAYEDPSTPGDGTGDPYAGSSFEPFVPPEEAPLEEEAPVPEAEDPEGLGSF